MVSKMARLVTVILVLAVIACVIVAPVKGHRKKIRPRPRYSVTAKDGSIGVGYIGGGNFGPGAFSIGHGGKSSGKGDGGHGGNVGTNTYGGTGGDTGHTSYA